VNRSSHSPKLSPVTRAAVTSASCFLLALVWAISLGAQAQAAPRSPEDKHIPPPMPTGTACNLSFSDVSSSDWFYEHVQWLVCNEIASGYSDGTFRPYNNTTRAQLAKMVVRAAGWHLVVPDRPTFSDVPVDSPFYQYVETAVQHAAITGYTDGTFRPANNVTRGQLAKITVLARNWDLLEPATPTFTDVSPESAFFTYVETAVEKGIIAGYGDGTFRPGNDATRAQLAKIVQIAFTTP
jgi:hypothetical protein